MDTLLANNNDAALIGDWDGNVRTEKRPADMFITDWEEQLRHTYAHPEHWYPDVEGAPFTKHTGGRWYEDGQMKAQVIEGIKPYESFSDESSGLSVRGAFLSHVHTWVIADREREPAEED